MSRVGQLRTLGTFLAMALLLLAANRLPAAEGLPGIVVDDSAAVTTGTWKASTHTAGYHGVGYQHATGPELHTATFKLTVPAAGEYHLLVGYTPGGNRSPNASLVFAPAKDGPQNVRLNQTSAPQGPLGLHYVGKYPFAAGEAAFELSTRDATGVVIADVVVLWTPEQFAKAKSQVVAKKPAPAAKPKPAAKAEAAPVPVEPVPPLVRAPLDPARHQQLTAGQLDALLAAQAPELSTATKLDDAQFLRRVSLDLIGRSPTRAELQAFVSDSMPTKRAALIDRLLASPEFGENWGAYFSDVVSYRVPNPELTFLNYQPFKAWLAESINRNRGWDEMTYDILTAQGKVSAQPQATFLGFHQADKSRLAAETSRVFLGTQIQCAECHDHKFIDLPQETFHEFAAFFVRTSAKMPQNDSNGVEVISKADGEHKLPAGKQPVLAPKAFDLLAVDVGASDIARRSQLAAWTVSRSNPFFAKALVNRVWARLMGRGFCEPVDEIGELADQVIPEVHTAVANHFVAADFDIKSVFRLIANTDAYQRELRGSAQDAGRILPKISTARLRGDEIFRSLVSAISLPNITPPADKPTGAIRFPPPPKSTRDLVNDAFGFDPSLDLDNVARTMMQAMFMMNNEQIQKQVDARPESETHLAKLLAREGDDAAAVRALFEHVLSRPPRASETEIALRHIAELKDRRAAFEDLLWSLLNSAEFTTRR